MSNLWCGWYARTIDEIERIEVLKGPQGTLFGRNSAAGAISIVTNQPANEFDSLLRVRFGQYGKQYYEGMINTPITDSLALRMNGVYNKSDGWLQDAATGQDLAPEENWAGRVALKWNLSDDTSATLSWDHDTLDQLARPLHGVPRVRAVIDGNEFDLAPVDAAAIVDHVEIAGFSPADRRKCRERAGIGHDVADPDFASRLRRCGSWE